MLVIDDRTRYLLMEPEVRPQSMKLSSAEEKENLLGPIPVLRASQGIEAYHFYSMLTQLKDMYSNKPRRVQVLRPPSVVDKQLVAPIDGS